jgi:thioesterase domain-containing protein
MASLYVREIRKFQPHGPYLLGGYCLGGTIALEMAQQLREQGESVALLALFDTMNWSRVRTLSLWGKARHRGWRLIFHVQNVLFLNFKEKVTFLREKLRTLQDRTRLWRGIWLGRLMHGHHRSKSPTSILAEVWGINDRAALNYVPRPYPGVITDFRPTKQYAEYAGPDVKWDGIAAQEVISLPVYPAGMLLEPFVRDLAAALKKCVDKTHLDGGFLNSEQFKTPLQCS